MRSFRVKAKTPSHDSASGFPRTHPSIVPSGQEQNTSFTCSFDYKGHACLMIFPNVRMDLETAITTEQLTVEKQPLVLAVDDDEDNLILMGQVLALLNCTVLSASDGEMALSLVREYHLDLIVLDIRLSDMDGFEVIRQLKTDAELAKIPIVAVTALAKPEDRDRILLAGCNAYLCKPFGIDELEAILHRYLNLPPFLVGL